MAATHDLAPRNFCRNVRALGHEFTAYYGWQFPPPALFFAIRRSGQSRM